MWLVKDSRSEIRSRTTRLQCRSTRATGTVMVRWGRLAVPQHPLQPYPHHAYLRYTVFYRRRVLQSGSFLHIYPLKLCEILFSTTHATCPSVDHPNSMCCAVGASQFLQSAVTSSASDQCTRHDSAVPHVLIFLF